MSVLIFANGDMKDGADWVRPYLADATAVIAADGGSRHLYALQQPPDVVLGDMDSLSDEIKAWLNQAKPEFITHSPAKDETDLELALLYAVAHYPDDLYLFGMLGGRLDQTLANILLLTHPRLQGRSVTLLTARERAWLVQKETVIEGQPGDLVSLIPLGMDVYIQQTTGLQWPLQNELLAFGPARGISNVLTAVSATVTIQSGPLLCIHTPDHS